jgi:branched-subunit amino acid aminotransferase/4-amino-4-deoxychorismate lyase
MTRRTVLELCRETNLLAEERPCPPMNSGRDEVFITSTAGGIIPITRIAASGRRRAARPVTLRLKRTFGTASRKAGSARRSNTTDAASARRNDYG